MMNEHHRRWISGWRAAALGIVIGLTGFFVAKTFLAGISPSRVGVMAVGFLGVGVSFGLTLLWSTLPLDHAQYKKSGVLRGLMGMAGGVGVVAWAAGVHWLIWIAGALTLVLMRLANMRLNR
jgi:hypothetical protein